MGKQATMLSKVLHILPRSFLETLAVDYVKQRPGEPTRGAIARQYLEGRILHAATPEMREEIAEYLHKQLCPPCVVTDGP